MRFLPTALPEVVVVEPDIHRDGRGYFLETWRADAFAAAGLPAAFVQDNLSGSSRGTLRGLHAQRLRPQGKLVRVVSGEIFDIAVDLRRGSKTFLRHVAVALSGENARACYIPPGFAHGFCVVSDFAEVEYKVTAPYDPADELRILWNDPEIGIAWPVRDPILSEKDRAAMPVRDLRTLSFGV